MRVNKLPVGKYVEFLSSIFLRECMEISVENLYVDIGSESS